MPPTAVYAAEEQWSAVLDRGGTVDFFGSRIDIPAQRRFGDMGAVQRYVDAVLALPEVAAAFPAAGPVTVRERAGQRRAHYEPGTGTIAIPMRTFWAGREAVVLHELAHHVACSSGIAPERASSSWHGVAYRSAMTALVATVLGEGAALLLRAGYDAAGVRADPAGRS